MVFNQPRLVLALARRVLPASLAFGCWSISRALRDGLPRVRELLGSGLCAVCGHQRSTDGGVGFGRLSNLLRSGLPAPLVWASYAVTDRHVGFLRGLSGRLSSRRSACTEAFVDRWVVGTGVSLGRRLTPTSAEMHVRLPGVGGMSGSA